MSSQLWLLAQMHQKSPSLLRFENILKYDQIQYCINGFSFNEKKGSVVLFTVSVLWPIHCSSSTESVTFDRWDCGKFHKWCKVFDYIIRMDFFSPDPYSHRGGNREEVQLSITCIMYVMCLRFVNMYLCQLVGSASNRSFFQHLCLKTFNTFVFVLPSCNFVCFSCMLHLVHG